MNQNSSSYSLLVKRIGWVLLGYSFCRILYLIFNLSFFQSVSGSELLMAFFYGLRYDITAIVISNTPVILLHLLPEKIFFLKPIKQLTKFVFISINSFMFLLNTIDFGLFRFTAKRATADVFKILSFGNDFQNTVPKMIVDFWYVLLILFLILYLLVRLYPQKGQLLVFKKINIQSTYLGKFLLLVTFVGLFLIGFRGGTQFKPLTIISASKYGSSNLSPLILNTPFTFLKTFGKSELKAVHFMSETEENKLSPVIHSPLGTVAFRPMNVVLIILESFGKEYSGLLNNNIGYTPFLDSLMMQSYYCTDAFANGKRSIEGIPAITSGLPALTNEPIITSSYGGNSMTSIANLLDQKAYQTYFFHGGTNGTMGFDNFSKAVGYKNYFGRTEYNNDNDFDGTWGIYDEPFLHRTVDELSKSTQPFFATLFTISSHHPYSIPEQYKKIFKDGSLPIHKSIRYADYALSKFFSYASKQKWYRNTLFVITADHTALSEKQFYMNRQGLYSIPLIFFSPTDSIKYKQTKTTQQIDILPSILSYLNYDKPYFAFGQSVFNDSVQGFAINYLNDTYQLIQDNIALIYDGNNSNELIQFKDERSSHYTVKPDSIGMEKKMKAFIQQYNSSLINNKMIIR